nr:mucin-2-like [Penaeus vannamei]
MGNSSRRFLDPNLTTASITRSLDPQALQPTHNLGSSTLILTTQIPRPSTSQPTHNPGSSTLNLTTASQPSFSPQLKRLKTQVSRTQPHTRSHPGYPRLSITTSSSTLTSHTQRFLDPHHNRLKNPVSLIEVQHTFSGISSRPNAPNAEARSYRITSVCGSKPRCLRVFKLAVTTKSRLPPRAHRPRSLVALKHSTTPMSPPSNAQQVPLASNLHPNRKSSPLPPRTQSLRGRTHNHVPRPQPHNHVSPKTKSLRPSTSQPVSPCATGLYNPVLRPQPHNPRPSPLNLTTHVLPSAQTKFPSTLEPHNHDPRPQPRQASPRRVTSQQSPSKSPTLPTSSPSTLTTTFPRPSSRQTKSLAPRNHNCRSATQQPTSL